MKRITTRATQSDQAQNAQHDGDYHDDFESIHKSIRHASIIGVACAIFLAGIFFAFSSKIARTSDAREQLIVELHTNETNKRLASSILLEVEKGRLRDEYSEMQDQWDAIELLAMAVLNGE